MVSLAEHFHERTKYDPDTINARSQGLDWGSQPSPYKQYKLGNRYDLKHYLYENADTSTAGLLLPQWQRLSKLLFCCYGLTAKVPTISGEPIFLRAAPSAGGLYPAELYIVSGGTPLLPGGLYNYQAREHGLLQYWSDPQVWEGLKAACFRHPLLEKTQIAFVISAVFFRSAWRYQDRAYRRIGLDIGHLLGNAMLAASLNDFHAHLISGFMDPALNELLYIDPRHEGCFCVVPILDRGEEQPPQIRWNALASSKHLQYPKIPDGELLGYLHHSSMITQESTPTVQQTPQQDKYNFPFCTRESTHTTPIPWGDELSGLEATILKRRSTRSYNGGSIDVAELKAILHFTYQSSTYLDQGLEVPEYCDLSLIETFIAISHVSGLEEGCYYYAPAAQELRQIRFKNFRKELHFLCLGQDLGRNAAAVVFHTANLETAVERYGDRVYRYLHMDAGHLGQRLNLAAIHLGLGVSGIGGFFDQQVNEVLGIPPSEAVLYLTTLGQPG